MSRQSRWLLAVMAAAGVATLANWATSPAPGRAEDIEHDPEDEWDYGAALFRRSPPRASDDWSACICCRT
jgi:hypothetical protein